MMEKDVYWLVEFVVRESVILSLKIVKATLNGKSLTFASRLVEQRINEGCMNVKTMHRNE